MKKAKIPVGVSSCLLGNKVRYDGGHKWNQAINQLLICRFEFIPLCPEVAVGLGTPREPIKLVHTKDSRIHAIGVNNHSLDITQDLETFSRSKMPELSRLCGYIVKSKSPSCGLESVNISINSNQYDVEGRGIFTRILLETYQSLPVVEENHLDDPLMREVFFERVYAYAQRLNYTESTKSKEKLMSGTVNCQDK